MVQLCFDAAGSLDVWHISAYCSTWWRLALRKHALRHSCNGTAAYVIIWALLTLAIGAQSQLDGSQGNSTKYAR